jgi:hypothetical protein
MRFIPYRQLKRFDNDEGLSISYGMKIVFPHSNLIPSTEALEYKQGGIAKRGEPLIVPDRLLHGLPKTVRKCSRERRAVTEASSLDTLKPPVAGMPARHPYCFD